MDLRITSAGAPSRGAPVAASWLAAAVLVGSGVLGALSAGLVPSPSARIDHPGPSGSALIDARGVTPVVTDHDEPTGGVGSAIDPSGAAQPLPEWSEVRAAVERLGVEAVQLAARLRDDAKQVESGGPLAAGGENELDVDARGS